jgi:DNA (cytosine-5)-methyltransferase 1
MTQPLRYISVCSGMEAASVAWHHLGWKPVAFSEIEPFPCAILKHHFTQPNYPYDVPNLGSLTEFNTWPLATGDVDLLVGGTPCQAFSVAGKRGGLNDPRGQLMLSFLDLAAKLQPRYVLWENVPGVLSSGQPKGSDFGCFIQGLVERGYGVAWRMLDAQFHGVPQRRKRIFVCATRDPVTGLGDWKASAEILSLAEGLSRHLEESQQKGKGSSSDAEGGVGADGMQRTVGTLCADTHPGAYSGQDAYTGRLIPQNTSHWEGSEVHPTLNQSASGCGSPGYSNQELFSQQGGGLVPALMFKIRGGSPVETGEQGGTPGKGAGKGFLGSEEKAFTIATAPDQWLAQQVTPIQDGREMEKNQNGMGVGNPGDPAYTIDTTGAQAAAIPYRKSKRASSTTDDETWVEAEASNTLNNFDLGDTRTTHAVVQGVDLYNQTLTGDLHVPLRTAGGHGAPACIEPIQPQGFAIREDSKNNTFHAKPIDVSTCVTSVQASAQSHHMQSFVVQSCSDVAPTVTSSGPPYSRTGNERVEAEALVTMSQPHIVQASELRLRGQITEKSVCPTLTADAKQGDTEPLAVHAISFQPGNLMRKAGSDPSTETFPTLTKDSGDQSPHVATVYENSRRDAIRIYEGTSPTLQSFMGTGGCNVPMVQDQNKPIHFDTYNQAVSDVSMTLSCSASDANHVGTVFQPAMAVRRLTPVECERLQGFPDNWSRISWKGKPAEECPDGPRYKACGNSMAVPVMRFIGEAIARYEANRIKG